MRWGKITQCGPVRQRNEDWLCVCPEIGLFAVADGMGGHLAGHVASKMAIDIISSDVKNNLNPRLSGRQILVDSIWRANETIFSAATLRREYSGMGTTVSACLIQNRLLLVANVGDSRTLLWRHQTISKLTNDHSLVQALVDGGGITPEDAINHPKRNVLTRALGAEPRVEVDLFEYQIWPGDGILLCTDGLTGFVPETRISEVILSSSNPEQVVHNLYSEAVLAGSNDNITIIFVVVD